MHTVSESAVILYVLMALVVLFCQYIEQMELRWYRSFIPYMYAMASRDAVGQCE